MKKGASKKSGMRKIWNQRLIPCLFAAGGLGIYLLFPICIPQTRPVSPDGRILRDSYGGDEQEYQVLVDGLDVGTQEVTVKVSPRSYSKEEAEQVFSGIRDRLEELIREGTRLSQR